MDHLYQKVIEKLQSQIIDDVNVDCGVMDRLKKDNILSYDEVDLISRQKSREAKIKLLLKILFNCGPYALKSFHESLEMAYEWLYSSITTELKKNKETFHDTFMYDTTDSYRSSIMPMPPELNVDRKKKIEELTNALKELSPEKYVVLHGMKGYGKSCLASMTLRNSPNIRKHFKDIWWMNFGCKESLENLIQTRLYSLYHKIITSNCLHSILNSQEAITKIQIDDVRRELKKHFEDCSMHMNSLLVLDDVSDKRIIETFDFHCKILVLTTDVEVLDNHSHDGSIKNRQKKIIKMHDGFTEEESLQLFANALNTEKEALPAEAKIIHHDCGGMPILIAMFAAQFQEFGDDMKKNRDRWQYYIEAIRNKDVSTKIVEKSIAKQTAIFDMCIKQLSVEEKSRYFNLAIFSEDVNITPKTLSILWDDKILRVDEFMVNLRKKSLVFKWWNEELDTYIYGVHELLLSHLRKLNKSNLVEMHKEFVLKYFNHCNNDLSQLPTDNYSYSYIGHHLEEAQMYDEFKKVYLDFKFIQAKICNSGVNDLLLDLKKYRRYIKMSNNPAQEEEIENKIIDLENFLKTYAKTVAEYRNRGCLDLIQMALSSNTNRGFVYETAKSLASSKAKEYLYLLNNYKPLDDHMIPQVHHEEYQEPRSTEVCTIHFTDDPDKIIIGGKSGKLTRWDFSEARRHIFFDGFDPKSIITKVVVSHNGKFFIALNKQSIIKLFNLSDIEEIEDACKKIYPSERLPIPSTPIEKQVFWTRRNNGEVEDMSLATLTMDRGLDICDITLSFDDQTIAACTMTGVIKVWNILYEKKEIKITEIKIENVHEDKPQQQLLAFSIEGHRLSRVNKHGDIYVFVLRNNEFRYTTYINPLNQNEDLQEKLIYFKEIKKNNIHEDEKEKDVMNYILVTGTTVIHGTFATGFANPRKRILTTTNKNTKFTAATLTHDEQYLITADNEDLIKIWNIDNSNNEPEKIYKERATVLDTYYDDYHIIAWGNKSYIQKMIFQPHVSKTPQVVTSIFDAVIHPIGNENEEKDEDVVIQDIDRKKIKLSIFKDMIDARGKILQLMLNSKGDKIFYVEMYLGKRLCRYNIENYEQIVILVLPPDSDFMKFIEYEDQFSNKHVVIAWKGNAITNDKFNPKKNLWLMNCDNTIIYGFIEDVGEVVAFQKMNDKYAIAISEDEKFIVWKMINHDIPETRKQELICEHFENFKSESKICFSTSSSDGSMLAVLKANSCFHLYTIQYDVQKDDNPNETCTKIELYFKGYDPHHNLISCAFSPDNKYLAIGTSTGEVLLFNMMSKECAIQGICILHKSPILQLHWAPSNIGVPILLSINCDELAWWKADLIINKANEKKRRSRMGMTRSATIPPSSSSGSLKSLSLDLLPNFRDIDSPDGTMNVSLEENSNNHDSIDKKAYEFWSSKKVLYDNKWPGLLGLVQLHPHGRGAKICVSSDFRKFLSVDTQGSINKLTLFQFQ
ncbi:uncharacterized protein Dark [Chelonus insularis]|uniref:uncharacterized protein Dark n=1 Tax=Chelonus insularis TaxID=460826 RepID=UPI0015888928|nr:uncharacterized protein LOC118070307 [Chelonus insularis]XP_034944736.1 uncharacterized protein LOC118070307 [Chelonus insularis]